MTMTTMARCTCTATGGECLFCEAAREADEARCGNLLFHPGGDGSIPRNERCIAPATQIMRVETRTTLEEEFVAVCDSCRAESERDIDPEDFVLEFTPLS